MAGPGESACSADLGHRLVGIFADTVGMFLRSKTRKKDGKEHRYWSVVENRRVADARVVQRHVLYLGEINDAQHAAWCRSIEVFDEDRSAAAQITLFPEDRAAPELACAVVQVKLSGLQLRRPRQWGVVCLALRASRLTVFRTHGLTLHTLY